MCAYETLFAEFCGTCSCPSDHTHLDVAQAKAAASMATTAEPESAFIITTKNCARATTPQVWGFSYAAEIPGTACTCRGATGNRPGKEV